MPLFKKPDEHAGSGIDKPQPKGIVEKVVEKVKAVATPSPAAPPAAPTKTPSTP